MFRHPRMTEPIRAVSDVTNALKPIPAFVWGQPAIGYLGTPTLLGHPHIVVRDEDFDSAVQKLVDAGFPPSTPRRTPAPEVLQTLRDPQRAIDRINAGYKSLDGVSRVFEYPEHFQSFRSERIFLVPNSFAHLPLPPLPLNTAPAVAHTKEGRTDNAGQQNLAIDNALQGAGKLYNYHGYDVFDNSFYPRESAIVESFVTAAVDEIKRVRGDFNVYEDYFSSWDEVLRSWVALVVGYLDVQKDALDHCKNKHVVTWYSKNFGKDWEERYGTLDRRVAKRLGSGKEFAYDMTGKKLKENEMPRMHGKEN
ncbi:hypothetical protein L228DRAFT_249340 [Xylona heveae TC161]|uniref:Uncharacterized protein n=1 Tax=Xylona heveae (strain CBS 132557 / TC161) TaxID=1328760 RepID=A0A165AJM2_XYLHT|nr:hypothetical protein L228DRAFT_249340 [Xylona heveae TC161]KZF20587.1 hypothetical protein L228DRAFT_249340 [Xylona heveae TC161]